MRGRGKRGGGGGGRGGSYSAYNYGGPPHSNEFNVTVAGTRSDEGPRVVMPTGESSMPYAGEMDGGYADPYGEPAVAGRGKAYKRGGKNKPSAVRYPATADTTSSTVEVVMPTASGFAPTQRSADPPSIPYSTSSSAPTVVLSASADPSSSSDSAEPVVLPKTKSVKSKPDPRSPNKSPVVQKYWSPKTRTASGGKLPSSPLRPSPSGLGPESDATPATAFEFDVSVPDKTTGLTQPAPGTAVHASSGAPTGSVDIMTPSPVRFMKPAPTPGNPNPDVTARASSRNEVLQQQQQPLLPSSGDAASKPGPSGVPASADPKMVPVFRGGCMYMVPESEAEAYAGGDGDVDPTAAVVSSEEMLALNPEVIPGGPRRRTFRSMFMPDSLYEHYLSQSRMLLAKVEPADPRYKELPPTYTCMLPLDNEAKTRGATGTLGYVTALYKVIDRNDGLAYCVRRVDYVRAHHQVTHQAQKRWANVSHPGIVQLRSCFVYTSAILFVHDYHPGARTLREAFIASPSTPLTESTLWSFACQLAAAIQCVHLREMCFRAVHIDKILMTGHNRVRISSSGLLDVLEAESQVSLADNQRGDVLGYANVLLQLACRNAEVTANPMKALDLINGKYSPDFIQFLYLMMTSPVTISDVMLMLQPRIAKEYALALDHGDAMDSILGQESENGRLARLLIKLGFVNERPDQDGDRTWAETGDRYLLKLFRDYVFHQNDEEGKASLDLAHVVDCLNRLDIGDTTPILLSSRDERTLLMATFTDVRSCLEKAIHDLREPRPVVAPPVKHASGLGSGSRLEPSLARAVSAPTAFPAYTPTSNYGSQPTGAYYPPQSQGYHMTGGGSDYAGYGGSSGYTAPGPAYNARPQQFYPTGRR